MFDPNTWGTVADWTVSALTGLSVVAAVVIYYFDRRRQRRAQAGSILVWLHPHEHGPPAMKMMNLSEKPVFDHGFAITSRPKRKIAKRAREGWAQSKMFKWPDALRIAQRSGDDHALSNARMTLGVALVHRRTAPERDRGQKLLAEVSEMFLRRGYALGYRPILDMYLARDRARRGDRDGALSLMRAAVDDMYREGRLLLWGVPATGVLVETLLDRGADDDVAAAEAAIERLAVEPVDEGLVTREIWLLRLRAQLARAHGDEARYREYRDRYRDMARSLGFEGHIAWAEAMP
jgi:hypothetical protein